MTRGQIESEVDELFGGGGKATQVYRGLAKVLEDRAEFEVVLGRAAGRAARESLHGGRRLSPQMRAAGTGPAHRNVFRRDEIIKAVAGDLNIEPDAVMNALFADLRDENRLLRFEDLTAQRLIDRYNVGSGAGRLAAVGLRQGRGS